MVGRGVVTGSGLTARVTSGTWRSIMDEEKEDMKVVGHLVVVALCCLLHGVCLGGRLD